MEVLQSEKKLQVFGLDLGFHAHFLLSRAHIRVIDGTNGEFVLRVDFAKLIQCLIVGQPHLLRVSSKTIMHVHKV